MNNLPRPKPLPAATQPPLAFRGPYSSSADNRALVVSSVFTHAEAVEQIGQQAYSYWFVYRAFAPLLERWGCTIEITRPESRLDYALWRARAQNLEPMHLSFLPLHVTYLTAHAANIGFPFWEFPDLPSATIANNSRNNWKRIADRMALLMTASRFTRDTFVRAGVKTPIHVVPVPIQPAYFDVPKWEAGQCVRLNCPCYIFPQKATQKKLVSAGSDPWAPPADGGPGFFSQAKRTYKGYIRPKLPKPLDRCLTTLTRAAKIAYLASKEASTDEFEKTPHLDLSGIVYTSVMNPFDPRKNWGDLITGFLLAMKDREDATLVIKLAVGEQLEAVALEGILGYYQSLGIDHRCKMILITDYLSDAQMLELTRASTYYLCTSHAEGACLPLQDFAAAGRPGIAPLHTAMRDYFRDDFGFVVASHPEPTYFPHDPEKRLGTSWERLVWQSLYQQLRTSYEVAKADRTGYRAMSVRGRERMADYASLEAVWPRLVTALDSIIVPAFAPDRPVAARMPAAMCKAS